MKILFYKLLERLISKANKTILYGYNSWKWDKMTKPVGVVLSEKESIDWAENNE